MVNDAFRKAINNLDSKSLRNETEESFKVFGQNNVKKITKQ